MRARAAAAGKRLPKGAMGANLRRFGVATAMGGDTAAGAPPRGLRAWCAWWGAPRRRRRGSRATAARARATSSRAAAQPPRPWRSPGARQGADGRVFAGESRHGVLAGERAPRGCQRAAQRAAPPPLSAPVRAGSQAPWLPLRCNSCAPKCASWAAGRLATRRQSTRLARCSTPSCWRAGWPTASRRAARCAFARARRAARPPASSAKKAAGLSAPPSAPT